MKKVIEKLTEQIEMHERHLMAFYQNNDKENISYFQPFIDGLLFARDLLEGDGQK
ncbi:hypothetical protein LCGC14_1334640 [marine sediment metagenome]|uniref:Uncharacterized protein n=1 Tax=marine sediment metagenome TaxID=412755 RepID=A0A0F9L1J8_9ZZZZ